MGMRLINGEDLTQLVVTDDNGHNTTVQIRTETFALLLELRQGDAIELAVAILEAIYADVAPELFPGWQDIDRAADWIVRQAEQME
jgi:hypothetical protein